MTDTPHEFDKFTPPGRIPDAADPRWRSEWPDGRPEEVGGTGPAPDPSPRSAAVPEGQREGGYGVPTQDWLSRGLKHPAGRGWEADPRAAPDPDVGPDGWKTQAWLDRKMAEYGVTLRPPPGKAGTWPKGWLPGDPPLPPAPAPDDAFFAPDFPCAKFDAAAQVRFLDGLATTGNVRVSAQQVGVSHETAYRLRRRDARFANLWSAALVHARHRVGGVFGDRALDGVVEEVWFRGELVGHRRRYDSRLLLAHMARLDQLADEPGPAAAKDAVIRAEWFDAELARLAGHPEPEGFDQAQGLWDERYSGNAEDEDGAAPPPPPPTRREWVAWYRSQALEGVKRKDEERVWVEATEAAGTLYDEWSEGGRARLDAILGGGAILAGGGGDCEPDAAPDTGSPSGPPPASASPTDDPPREYKSLALGLAHRARPLPVDRVTSVNTPLDSPPQRADPPSLRDGFSGGKSPGVSMGSPAPERSFRIAPALTGAPPCHPGPSSRSPSSCFSPLPGSPASTSRAARQGVATGTRSAKGRAARSGVALDQILGFLEPEPEALAGEPHRLDLAPGGNRGANLGHGRRIGHVMGDMIGHRPLVDPVEPHRMRRRRRPGLAPLTLDHVAADPLAAPQPQPHQPAEHQREHGAGDDRKEQRVHRRETSRAEARQEGRG